MLISLRSLMALASSTDELSANLINWQRERMVSRRDEGRSQVSMILVLSGGSSRILRSECWAGRVRF